MTDVAPGQLWLDDGAYRKDRTVRLLRVTGIRDGYVDAVAEEGPAPSQTGVPRGYWDDSMSWQGYWSAAHQKLDRLRAPYAGAAIEGIPGAQHAEKLHGTAALVSAIIPSWSPFDARLFNQKRVPVIGADLERSVQHLPPGNPYLRLTLRQSHLRVAPQRPARVHELWYQKQGNAWYLVRTLITPS